MDLVNQSVIEWTGDSGMRGGGDGDGDKRRTHALHPTTP